MSPPRKKKPGATWTGATGQTENGRTYSAADILQPYLAQRLNGSASVAQLLPLVLTKTLTFGFRPYHQSEAPIQDGSTTSRGLPVISANEISLNPKKRAGAATHRTCN